MSHLSEVESGLVMPKSASFEPQNTADDFKTVRLAESAKSPTFESKRITIGEQAPRSAIPRSFSTEGLRETAVSPESKGEIVGWILYRDHAPVIASEVEENRQFVEEATKANITLVIMNPDNIDVLVDSERNRSIIVDGQPSPLPDFVLPRMGSDTTYFAFSVIRQLEKLGVPCLNSSVGIEAVKDKLYAQQLMVKWNLPVPDTLLARFPVNVDFVEKTFGFPVIIKTLSGTRGEGVFLADDRKAFKDLMKLIEITNTSVNIIIQRFIEDSFGRDLRVFVIGGRVVACMKRQAADEDEFKANFSTGGSVERYPLSSEIEWLALEACRCTGLDIAGVDLLFDKGHFKICEVNSSPGFIGLQQACDINVPAEIYKVCSCHHAYSVSPDPFWTVSVHSSKLCFVSRASITRTV
ncbi:alpha-L-glutamate ligase [Carpediemonas membranifera]|uniref:N-acetylaspartylglutamate synthase n=1 Tax=Carpediemonas membranifera TaxID=201153 RepID=A0A8J6AUR8_9EUKA|nr:alpha-L-glutamate ligase [Carpediemonas membranifera]|eukprot:KAG9392085.1 alpha-L-glutamate ligase [Carpediemonas membranifera]